MSQCRAINVAGLQCTRRPRHKGMHRSRDAVRAYEWGGKILLRMRAIDPVARAAHALTLTAAAINRAARRRS